jgi:hypothetical protein
MDDLGFCLSYWGIVGTMFVGLIIIAMVPGGGLHWLFVEEWGFGLVLILVGPVPLIFGFGILLLTGNIDIYFPKKCSEGH